MAIYDVKVYFVPKGDGTHYVTVDKYPVPGGGMFLMNEDSVKWTTDDAVELQVGFEFAYQLGGTSAKSTGLMGPFETFSHPGGQQNILEGKLSRVGDVPGQDWRYMCIFFRNGKRTPWKPGSFDGGVDTHRLPPA